MPKSSGGGGQGGTGARASGQDPGRSGRPGQRQSGGAEQRQSGRPAQRQSGPGQRQSGPGQRQSDGRGQRQSGGLGQRQSGPGQRQSGGAGQRQSGGAQRNVGAVGSGPKFRTRPGSKYIAFFKPYGVLSQFTQSAESGKRVLSEFGFPPGIYPVGRLDHDSEGLLILSDDGRLNKALLSPERGHHRTYLAQVEHVPTEEQLEKLRNGVLVQGERTRPAQAEVLAAEPALPERPVPIRFRKNVPTAWIQLALQEGKNRQVRRMTAAVGLPTLRLMRISIGKLTLFKLALQPGDWLRLSPEQVEQLFESGTNSALAGQKRVSGT